MRSTSDAPAGWAVLSDSPKTANAGPTVTTGSRIDRTDAAVGPTRTAASATLQR